MTETLSTGHLPADGRYARRGPKSAVTWTAVFAGAVAATVLTIVLMILGSALGFATVSPWEGEGASAGTIAISAVIWLIITQWISSALGGYLTGRLRTRWVDVHTDEIFFRDTSHGFLAWAVATIFVVVLAAGSIASVISGGAQMVGSAITAGTTAAAASDDDSENGLDPARYFIDVMFRSDPALPAQAEDGTTTSYKADRAEMLRVLLTRFTDGEISEADKGYLARQVAAETGLTQAEAQSRVNDVIARMDRAEQDAREAADAARKAAAKFSLFVFLSLLIGAFISTTAAAIGGRQRDDFEDLHRDEFTRPI